MLNLRADNQSIIKDAKYSYLIDNYSSGVSSVNISNPEGFFHNSAVIFGNIGSENTEILQLKKVNPATGELTFFNFSDVIIGGGIATVSINNPGTGYLPGQILTVVQAGGVDGSVRVATTGALGAITSITVDQSGYAYTVANGIATTGGGNNDATIDILTLTTASTATSILFSSPKSFIAGQKVEVFTSAGVSRGTGVVSASSDPTSAIMTLTAPGVVGTIPGDTIFVDDVTKYSHAESTKVTVIQYNKVCFFRTDTPSVPNLVPHTTIEQNQDKSITQTITTTISAPRTTVYTQPDDPSSVINVDFTPPIIFTGAIQLAPAIPIQVNDFYTTLIDVINSTGYGWYSFYNSYTKEYSDISSPIPYAGDPQNTVKTVFADFDSSMNTKELKLITESDRFSWLNEAVSYMTNELNLVNLEYMATEELKLTVYAGIAKYLLPQNFSDLLFVNDEKNDKMDSYDATHERSNVASKVRYAIRGKFIIFDPLPPQNTTVTLAYLRSASRATKLDDVIDLPNNAYYTIKDFMRFRAYQKLQNASESNLAFSFFKSQIDGMKIHSIRRDDSLDSFGIDGCANV